MASNRIQHIIIDNIYIPTNLSSLILSKANIKFSHPIFVPYTLGGYGSNDSHKQRQ